MFCLKQILGIQFRQYYLSNIQYSKLYAWSFYLSHRLWYHLASWYVAFFFLPSDLQKLFHKTFFSQYVSKSFFLSYTGFKSFLFSFTWFNTYSLVLWSFQLIISILSTFQKLLIYLFRTFLCQGFRSTQSDDPNYSHIYLLFSFLLNLFEKNYLLLQNAFYPLLSYSLSPMYNSRLIRWVSKIMKLIHLLYSLSFYRSDAWIISFSIT